MEDVYLMRVGMSKQFYPEIAHIFGISHYKKVELGEDKFSKDLMYFYKYGYSDLEEFFLQKLIDLFKMRFEGDSTKFDLITLYPTRNKNTLNNNMVSLAQKFSNSIEIPYKQIIRRNRDIKASHELKTFPERKDNVGGSIDVLEEVTGKNIMILDNTSTTGISLIDATNLLIEKGANKIACLCLGLSYTGRASDYQDLNKTLKYSKIISIFKTPYVSKEKREKHAKESKN